MFALHILNTIFILSCCSAIFAESTLVFPYYESTKFIISRAAHNQTNIPDKHSDRMSIFSTQPYTPHLENNLQTQLFYKTSNRSINNAVPLWSNNPVSMPQPNPIASNHALMHTSTAQPEGSFCRRSFDGQSGYCILASQCLHVIREHRVHGTKIDVCTYRGNIRVICCPLAAKHVEEQSVSAKKCLEYHAVLEGVKFHSSRKFSGKTCAPSLPLVVGGEVANKGEYPHMAALGWTQNDKEIKWSCGGTLISELFVLTAAHCATSSDKPPDVVRLGARNLNTISTDQQDIRIAVIRLYPEYRSSSYYHDIALLKLAQRVSISKRVQPACLWQLPDIGIPTVAAAGWGRTKFRGTTSAELQKVALSMIDQKLCKQLYRKERRLPNGISDEQFCAGHMTGGKDTCQGDSGGPLIAELPEMKCVKFAVGVTSFGKFCARPNAPGVYTKIYPYLDWIEDVAFKEY